MSKWCNRKLNQAMVYDDLILLVSLGNKDSCENSNTKINFNNEERP